MIVEQEPKHKPHDLIVIAMIRTPTTQDTTVEGKCGVIMPVMTLWMLDGDWNQLSFSLVFLDFPDRC